MGIRLPTLPYPTNALEPFCSTRTVELHYGRHHLAYVNQTIELTKGTRYEPMSLEQIVRATPFDRRHGELHRTAVQAWSHELFWKSMRPGGGGTPPDDLQELIDRDFGDYGRLCEVLFDQAVAHFGCGWAWLVWDNSKLAVSATSNADNPMARGATPLLAIDLWEHAYYLDYQDRRADFVAAFFDHLVSWDNAAAILRIAINDESRGDLRRASMRRARN
jgi:Fe-Mn family superoxide dismutase